MTEYDFSPGAVRAHMEKLQKIERWTLQVNPLTVRDAHTPATPAPDTFSSLPRDGSSRSYRPRHSRDPSYDRDRAGEGGYGYDKRERWRDRERPDSRRDRDMDRSFDDEDYDPYTNARPHRSKSNAITPSQPKHPPPAARAYTMPPKPTNTRRTSHDIYQHGSGSAGLEASKSQPQVYRGSSHDLNQNRPSSSHQGSKYNLPATAPATTSRRHNPRSASTNDVTSGKYSSGAAVYDQNKPHPSRSSFDHPRSAQAAPPSYGAPANGHAAQPASATLPRSAKPPHSRMPSSTALNPYPYGQYPSQTQLPMQQPQQKSQIYLPQRSQAHLPPPSQPQPQPQPTSHPPPAPSTATRKPPPAPLNLPPHPNAALPALKGGSYSAQVYRPSKTTAAKSAGYYPPAAGPYHVALPPGFQPQSGPAAPIPISPPHNRLAFQQTPSPLPTYSGPMPQLKEKPRPLIKRLLGSLTGSKASLSTTSFTPTTTTTTTAGNTTPGTEYTVPMSATQTRGVPLDSGVRPVSAPPMKSSRSRDRDRDREWEHAREYERERERASDRDRERERSRMAGGEKGGARWYDMEVDQQEWELVTRDDRDVYERVKRVEGGGKMQQQQQVHTHTRTPTHTLKKRREGGYDRRLSH